MALEPDHEDLCPSIVSSILGLKRALILELMEAGGVTHALGETTARAWRQNPASAPAWLKPTLQAHAAEKGERRRERKARTTARRAAREADPALRLVQEDANNFVNTSRRELGEAALAAGVTDPITPDIARRWRDIPETAPEWFHAFQAGQDARRLVRAAEDVARRAAEAEEERAREAKVIERLRRGAKSFSARDSWHVEVIVHAAARNLARGATLADLLPEEIGALRWARIDPLKHSTWPLHAGDCNGEGRNCDEGQREAIVAREMQNLERREERAAWSSENAELVASGRFEPGTLVSVWYGQRVGVVVKKNRVTVKVRFVGGKGDGWALIDKSMKPVFMEVAPTNLPTISVGECITVQCWDAREREVTVLEVQGPHFLGEYTIKSGAVRQAWFDALRVRV